MTRSYCGCGSVIRNELEDTNKRRDLARRRRRRAARRRRRRAARRRRRRAARRRRRRAARRRRASSLFNKDVPKKALLIGINYFQTDAELNGCINDVEDLEKFLQDKLYFDTKDLISMTDKQDVDSFLYPTEANIKNQIMELVSWANSTRNSELWLSFSGHGVSMADTNGDEADARDEAIYTVDNGYILDDWLRQALINKLRSDVKLFILMDCCHSGTLCDIEESCIENSSKQIFMMSGCKDDQTSADAMFIIRDEYEWRGALTLHFIREHGGLLKNHHSRLVTALEQGDFSQIPVFSHTCSNELSDKISLVK